MKSATASLQQHSADGRQGNILPREILGWVQSLQLPKPLKHPRRDLSNGFVIAEICSRYWKEVPMHSFVNTTSTANKNSNWFVLKKVFLKNGVPLSDKVVEGMIACKEDYAEAFLLQLYTILTGKKVTPAAPLASPAVEPQPFDPSTVPPLRESPTRLGDLFSDVGENSDREPLPSASLSVEEKEASFGMNSDGHASLRGPPPPRARGSVHESPQRMQQETAGDPSERVHLQLNYSTRPAEVTSGTVIRAPGSAVRSEAREMLEGAPVTTGGSRAMGWVEEEVRRVLTEQGETLAEAHDGVVSYFLKKESQLPESLRQAVWNPLLSSSTELAAMVIQDGEMHQLGRTFLTIRESYFNRRSIAFVGALLSQVADHNPLLALTILQDDVLTGEVIASLGRHLHYINAEYIATLMQSVVVTFSYVADPHVLLRRLLGHLQEVTSRGTLSVPVPKCVLLLLLRALLQRVCKRCSFTILDVSNNNNNNNNSSDKSVVYRELFDFSLDHACDGLSSESPKTRLAGAALAAAILLSDDVPLLQVVDATLLLIFPESEAQRGMDVSFDVVRNTYLCAALRRVRLQLSAKGESEALPLYRALFAALQDHLVQRICPLLSTAGNAKMKAVVAAELGAVVGVLDDEVAAEVGACVLRFILTKLPPDALSSVLDPEDQSGTTVVQPLLGVYSFADLLRSFPPVLLCACILQYYQVEEVTDLTPAVRDAVHWMFIAMVVVNGTRSLLTTESEEELDRWRTLLATFNNCVVPVYQSSDDNDDDGDSVAELNASIDKIYQTFSSYWPEEEEEDSNAEEERTELERALVWYRNVFG